ncbi:MAG: enoyl-CoA hydratase/isomerase family protein [Planctomycetota bacterium]
MISVEREERDGAHVRTIWLDRPDKRNALTPGMLTELVSQAEAAASAGDAVLLAGRGKAFCAGFDLAMCQAAPDGSVMRLLLTGLSDACRTLRTLDRPVVVAAHGAAVAGGCALLGGADVVVADRACTMGYPVVKLGVSPAVSIPFLRQSVTDGHARARALLPDTFTAADAEQHDLVHVLVEEAGEVHNRALEEAFRLAAIPPGAYAATKQWLNTIEGVVRRREDEAGLEASLGLTGNAEERERLGALDFGTKPNAQPNAKTDEKKP